MIIMALLAIGRTMPSFTQHAHFYLQRICLSEDTVPSFRLFEKISLRQANRMSSGAKSINVLCHTARPATTISTFESRRNRRLVMLGTCKLLLRKLNNGYTDKTCSNSIG